MTFLARLGRQHLGRMQVTGKVGCRISGGQADGYNISGKEGESLNDWLSHGPTPPCKISMRSFILISHLRIDLGPHDFVRLYVQLHTYLRQ